MNCMFRVNSSTAATLTSHYFIKVPVQMTKFSVLQLFSNNISSCEVRSPSCPTLCFLFRTSLKSVLLKALIVPSIICVVLYCTTHSAGPVTWTIQVESHHSTPTPCILVSSAKKITFLKLGDKRSVVTCSSATPIWFSKQPHSVLLSRILHAWYETIVSGLATYFSMGC